MPTIERQELDRQSGHRHRTVFAAPAGPSRPQGWMRQRRAGRDARPFSLQIDVGVEMDRSRLTRSRPCRPEVESLVSPDHMVEKRDEVLARIRA
jgi:hypothetical protein